MNTQFGGIWRGQTTEGMEKEGEGEASDLNAQDCGDKTEMEMSDLITSSLIIFLRGCCFTP